MSACISGVDSRHHKMLHVYIKTILHALEVHADVPAADVTIACYGAALQVHVPHAITLLGPNLSWELWRADAHVPLFETHLSKKIDKRSGTIDDFLQDISSRPQRRFICLVDLDLHVPAHVLRARNEQGVKPTVESENRFYESITKQYADICTRAASMKQVMVLSIPFRAPWVTEDYEKNKEHALWLHADEQMQYPKLFTFRQYNTRPRSTEVRGLCWCGGSGVELETVDWKKIDVDMQQSNARRVFRDHDLLVEFLEHYKTCTAQRTDLFENETGALRTWREDFVRNSLQFAEDNASHACVGLAKSRRVYFAGDISETR
jgi:hypothetical protein